MRGRRAQIASAVLLVGVGATTLDAPGTTAPSGLYGQVRRGPIMPVCVAEQPCDSPAPGVTLVFSRGGRDVARAVTRQDGKYRVRLAPGTYGVRRALRTARPIEPDHARVPAARFSRLDFSIDTGIR